MKYSWGGSGGTRTEIRGTVEGRDNKGNSVRGTISRDNNGEGGLEASAKHDSREKSSKSSKGHK